MKASESEPQMTCRKTQDDIKTEGAAGTPRDEPGGCLPIGQVVSGMYVARAWSRLSCGTREPGTDGKLSCGNHRAGAPPTEAIRRQPGRSGPAARLRLRRAVTLDPGHSLERRTDGVASPSQPRPPAWSPLRTCSSPDAATPARQPEALRSPRRRCSASPAPAATATVAAPAAPREGRAERPARCGEPGGLKAGPDRRGPHRGERPSAVRRRRGSFQRR